MSTSCTTLKGTFMTTRLIVILVLSGYMVTADDLAVDIADDIANGLRDPESFQNNLNAKGASSGVTSSSESELITRQNAAVQANVDISSFEGVMCGKLDFACMIGEEINKCAEPLIGDAKNAFNEAMGNLFKNNISPLLDQVKSVADTEMKNAASYVNAAINTITANVKDIIDDAAEQAKELAKDISRDVTEMVTKIINVATNALTKAMTTFFNHVQKLLDELVCDAITSAKELRNDIERAIKSVGGHWYSWSSCWKSLGFKITQSLADLGDVDMYRYHRKCVLLPRIKPKASTDDHLAVYMQGQKYASEYLCISQTENVPSMNDYFTKQWVWWGGQYEAWKNGPPKPNQPLPTPDPAAVTPAPVTPAPETPAPETPAPDLQPAPAPPSGCTGAIKHCEYDKTMGIPICMACCDAYEGVAITSTSSASLCCKKWCGWPFPAGSSTMAMHLTAMHVVSPLSKHNQSVHAPVEVPLKLNQSVHVPVKVPLKIKLTAQVVKHEADLFEDFLQADVMNNSTK